MSDLLYLGHPRELVELAVVFPAGHFVQLDDLLFQQHGLGPRYARVQTTDFHGHRSLSYAYLDLPGTTYDLITEVDNPQDLGSFEDLAKGNYLVDRLTQTFIQRSENFPTRQQLGLALVRARAENVVATDELGVHRLVKWALNYEKRGHWLAKHRQKAFGLSNINWDALEL